MRHLKTMSPGVLLRSTRRAGRACQVTALLGAFATAANVAVWAISLPLPFGPSARGLPGDFSPSLLGAITLLHGGWTALGAVLAGLAGLAFRTVAGGRLRRAEAVAASVGASALVTGAGIAMVLAAGSADWLYTLRAAGAGDPRLASYSDALGATVLTSLLSLTASLVATSLALRSAIGSLAHAVWDLRPRR